MPDRLNNSSEREYPGDITQRHVSPPLSREPSMMSSSARHSDRGHSPDGRSDNSRNELQERDGIVPAATSASQETGSFNAELLMNASLRRVGSRLGDYDKPRYASTLGPYQYFMDDEPQSNLSRPLSLEKPPRHRKYRSGSLNDGEMTAPIGQIEPSPQSLGGRELQDDKSMDFKDRVEKVPHLAQRQGGHISLLERLSSVEDMGQASTGSEQSLRDRLVPSKRDRDDMMNDGDGRERSYDGEDGYDSKRVKRRNGKGRRGGGRR